jgi:hypothetical protein
MHPRLKGVDSYGKPKKLYLDRIAALGDVASAARPSRLLKNAIHECGEF